MNLEIHFCEYNRRNPDQDRIYRPDGSGDYLFLLLKTPMKFHLNGETCFTRENACMLYTPGIMQHYEAIRHFRNSYIHFSCSLNPGEAFHLPSNTIFYPGNYDEIDEFIRKIQEERIAGQPFAAEKQQCLFTELFISIARSLQDKDGKDAETRQLYDAFLTLRLTMLLSYEKPWDTETMCRMVHLEKSQLFSYYRRFFHSTPHADLLETRLEKAKNLLTNEALPVSQAARQCGFADAAHFSRCFKKECGCSPSEYAGRQKGSQPLPLHFHG